MAQLTISTSSPASRVNNNSGQTYHSPPIRRHKSAFEAGYIALKNDLENAPEKQKKSKLKAFVKEFYPKRAQIDFNSAERQKIRLNVQEFKELASYVDNDTAFLQSCFDLLGSDNQPNNRDAIEFLNHGNTQSLFICDKDDAEKQKHVMVFCPSVGQSSTILDVHEWMHKGTEAEGIVGDENSLPVATAMLSHKSSQKKGNIAEFLKALKEKKCESFSILAISGGVSHAQQMIDAVGDDTSFKGAVFLSPVVDNPKTIDPLGLGVDITCGWASHKFIVSSKKKNRKKPTGNMTHHHGDITVYFSEDDHLIRGSGQDYIRKLKAAFGDQVECRALRHKDNPENVTALVSKTTSVPITEATVHDKSDAPFSNQHNLPMDYIKADPRLASISALSHLIPPDEKSILSDRLFFPKR